MWDGRGGKVFFQSSAAQLMPTPPTIITTLTPAHKLKVIQPHVVKGKTPAHHQTSCRLPHSSGHPRSFLLCTPPPHKLRADLQPGCPRSPLLFITQPRPPATVPVLKPWAKSPDCLVFMVLVHPSLASLPSEAADPSRVDPVFSGASSFSPPQLCSLRCLLCVSDVPAACYHRLCVCLR